MFKRIALFLATNLAVILVLSVVLRLLGVDQILDESGSDLNYKSLLILSLVIGFGVVIPMKPCDMPSRKPSRWVYS